MCVAAAPLALGAVLCLYIQIFLYADGQPVVVVHCMLRYLVFSRPMESLSKFIIRYSIILKTCISLCIRSCLLQKCLFAFMLFIRMVIILPTISRVLGWPPSLKHLVSSVALPHLQENGKHLFLPVGSKSNILDSYETACNVCYPCSI